MADLTRRALGAMIVFQVLLLLLIFISAGTLAFWQGWLFWTILSLFKLSLTLYYLRHDRAFLERRLAVGPGAEPHRNQKRIQSVTSVLIGLTFVVSGLDHRFGWSAVPDPAVFVADFLLLVAFVGYFAVFNQNRFAAGTVRVEENQTVVSTGLYGVVRHPMYFFAILQFLAIPVALGSYWGYVAAVPLCLAVAVRLLDEERVLCVELAGYEEYRRRVRARLIPFVW